MLQLIRTGLFLGALCLLSGCRGDVTDGGEINLTGTLLRLEDSIATMEVWQEDDRLLWNTLSFSTADLDKEGIFVPAVGDEICVTYVGSLEDPGEGRVVSWSILTDAVDGILLAVNEGTVAMEPQDAALLQVYGDIQFSMEYLDDKGFQPGDVVEVTYIRDIQPGPPAQIIAVDWGVVRQD